MRTFLSVLLVSAVLFGVTGAPVRSEEDPPDLDFQMKVDNAIEKGVAFLKGKRIGPFFTGGDHEQKDGNELILLTLIHAEVKETDPDFKALLKEALEDPLERTYGVVLTAMALEEHDRVKYQWRIHQCAQFLVDNMDSEGQVRYGTPTDLSHIPPQEEPKDVKTTSGSRGKKEEESRLDEAGLRVKPAVRRRIPVKQRRQAGTGHDHSNMQYAALGLRACHDAGIIFEPSLIKKFRNWWVQAQAKAADGARKSPLELDLPKAPSSKKGGSTQAGRVMRLPAVPRGWLYNKDGGFDGIKGSMTAGAVGALCICDYILGQDWRRNQSVLDGLQWISKNFTVEHHPIEDGTAQEMHKHFYYLYGLERAGMLFGTETIGSHRWYREGAEYLIKTQQGGGAWGGGYGAPIQTCFAVLFLKRATRSLSVATGSRRR